MYKKGQIYTVKGHIFRIIEKHSYCINHCFACTKVPTEIEKLHLKNEALYKFRWAVYKACLKIGPDLKLLFIK